MDGSPRNSKSPGLEEGSEWIEDETVDRGVIPFRKKRKKEREDYLENVHKKRREKKRSRDRHDKNRDERED